MCSCHRYLSEKDVDAPIEKVANQHSCRQVEADPEQRPHATARRREDGLETVSGHGARRAGGGPEEPAVLYPTRPHGLVVGHGSRLARRRSRLAPDLAALPLAALGERRLRCYRFRWIGDVYDTLYIHARCL